MIETQRSDLLRFIAHHPYIKVSRQIKWTEQKIIEEELSLILYEDRIETQFHVHYLRDVWDVSYKSTSAGTGLLYLHTRSGVNAFYVKQNPSQFIDHFIKIKASL